MRAALTALGFLSRLGPARAPSAAEFAASLAWYPAVGLVLGGLAALPGLLDLPASLVWVQAWLAVLLDAWLTRGLHLDGVADLGDAWGSGARGPRFWTILKDSRAGAFAVMALVLALTGRLVLLAPLFSAGLALAVPAAWGLGRLAPLALVRLYRGGPPGLGRQLDEALTPSALLWAGLTALLAGLVLLGPTALVLALILAALPLAWLSRLARRENGLNGDFLGAAIVAVELATLVAVLLATPTAGPAGMGS